MKNRNKKGQFAVNQSKNVIAVIMTMTIMFTTAFYAKEAYGGYIADTEIYNDNGQEIWHDIGVSGLSKPTCLVTRETDGSIRGYCGSNEKALIWSIQQDAKQEAKEQEKLTKKVTAFITKYSKKDSCHNIIKGKCLMASGKEVYEGAVACPRNLKLGTKVQIDGQIYTCEDRYATWVDTKRGLPTFDIFVEANPVGIHKSEVIIL